MSTGFHRGLRVRKQINVDLQIANLRLRRQQSVGDIIGGQNREEFGRERTSSRVSCRHPLRLQKKKGKRNCD